MRPSGLKSLTYVHPFSFQKMALVQHAETEIGLRRLKHTCCHADRGGSLDSGSKCDQIAAFVKDLDPLTLQKWPLDVHQPAIQLSVGLHRK